VFGCRGSYNGAFVGWQLRVAVGSGSGSGSGSASAKLGGIKFCATYCQLWAGTHTDTAKFIGPLPAVDGAGALPLLLANKFSVCRTNYYKIFCISVRIKAFAIKTNKLAHTHMCWPHSIAICIMVDYAYAMCACATKCRSRVR